MGYVSGHAIQGKETDRREAIPNPNSYSFGWHDPRLVFSGLPVNTDSNYLIVDLSQCEPITQEVADIIGSV